MSHQANAHGFTKERTVGLYHRRRTPNGHARDIEVVADVLTSPTVVIADSQPVMRRGVRTMLERSGGVAVLGEAATADEVVAETSRHRPDVVMMDLQPEATSGINVIGQVLRAAPGTGVLVFSDVDEDRAITEAIRAGARGYLTREAGPNEVLRGVLAVAAGQAIICRAIAARFGAWLCPAAAALPDPFSQLTAREREVLDRIAAGKSNATIARELTLAPKTISNRVSVIFGKLGTASRAEVIVLAREAGLGCG